MRKILLASALTLSLAGLVPATATANPLAPAAGTPLSASPQSARYGLPDFGDLVEQVGPAVVNISIVHKQTPNAAEMPFANDPFYDFLRRFGVPVPGMPGHPGNGARINRGIGSGFIVSADGYVLTNAHVVAGEDNGNGTVATEVTVTLFDKREFKARVIGIDRRTDVALIKIDARNLPAVKIGNADRSRVGEWVVAMGSPFGFDHSVTAGIISAKARRLPDENYVPFIQTDVAINPGNSGGPLFNLDGEVIGINSQIYSRSGGFMGISFAIPIDVAMNVKDQLISHGRVQRGRLGIAIQGLDKDLAQSFGLPDERGALVASVDGGGPADKAGLKPGDVVLSVDGQRIAESGDLPRVIGDKRPGTQVRMQVWRDGRSRELVATLEELKAETAVAAAAGENIGARLGLGARALSPQEAGQLNLRGGLVVESSSGAAARAGLQRGDIILALNNQPVSSVAQLRELLERAGNRFALLVQRGNSRLFVPVRLE